jgi:hypothetical protein
MGKLIALVAKKKTINGGSPTNYTTPEVVYVNDTMIKVRPGASATDLTTVEEVDAAGNVTVYQVYQKAQEIDVQRDPATTDVMLAQLKQLAVAGVGTTIASTLIMKYFNEMLTIGAGATEAGRLPTIVLNKCVCIVSNDAAGDAFKLFPNLNTETIDAGVAGAVKSIAAGSTLFLVATSATAWTTAVDRGR